jgi:hypothetical protein
VHATLFTCPACEVLFHAPAHGQKCYCPHCGQKLQVPALPGPPSPPRASPEQGSTVLARSAHFPIDPTSLLRLRVWGAAVRDRQGAHAKAPAEAVGLAKTLCDLLDARDHLQADNAREVLNGNVALLVGYLLLVGVNGPV